MIRYLSFIAILLTFISCRKQESETPADVTMASLSVPAGFTWEMSKATKISVPVTDTRFGDAIHVIAIYDDNGKLISKGSARVSSPFESTVSLPTTAKRVYLIKTAPDGSRTTGEMVVSGNALTIPMGIADAAGKSGGVKISGGPDPVSPDCSTGIDLMLFPTVGSTQTITVSNGQTVGLSGNFSGKQVDIEYGNGGGTLRICGTNVTIRTFNSVYASTYPQDIVITSSATVNFDISGGNTTIHGKLLNYGTINMQSPSFGHIGDFINYGVITFEPSSSYAMHNSRTAYNYGHIAFQRLSIRFGKFINEGTLSASNLHMVASEFENSCYSSIGNVYITAAFSSSKVSNRSFMNVNYLGIADSASKGKLYTYSGSMIMANTLHSGGSIIQQSGASLIKVTGVTTLLSGGEINGNIKFCDQNGIESNLGSWLNGAGQSCNLYIPTNPCNPIGNGTAIPGDADQDGISDALDDFPNDVTRAFNNPGSIGTLVFEDQWPKYGDYDMNDVVISYNYTLVTNANNKVTQVLADYSLKAAGGRFDNGFGVEFPLDRSKIASVAGATLESGQVKAVAILFTSMHTEFPHWNTIMAEPIAPAKNYHLELNIADAPDLSAFGISSFNPFIWNDGIGYGRGNEVHLPGRPPTSLANFSLFGQFRDNSNPSLSRYYLSVLDFPWGLDIPGTTFKYPIEGKDIGAAYSKMYQWVQSGGTQYSDWYSNTAVGYRNNAHIFNP